MDALAVITVALLVLLSAAVLWLITSVRRKPGDEEMVRLQSAIESLKADIVGKQMEGLVSLRESLDSASRGLNERLAEGTSAMDRRLSVVADIENKLGQLQRQTSNLEEIGKNIQQLSDLLKPPKLRGGLGEVFLENLLGQILPPALFDRQHQFSDGRRVDAVIKLGDRLLPVDSKFPLDAFARLQGEEATEATIKEFRRAIKGQIDSISEKYVLPDEGTTDFAVMYVPSEAVYYRLVSYDESELFEYALGKRVIPSSPGHLYAFLASVAAIYTEAGLAGNTRRLTSVVNGLHEALNRLDRLHERMAGSSRMLGRNLEKAQVEAAEMRRRLESLHEFTPKAEAGAEAGQNDNADLQ